MNATILHGGREGDGFTDDLAKLLTRDLEARHHNPQLFVLREREIRHCVGCFGCWLQTPGQCAQGDEAADITRAIVNSALLVFLTPVTFGGYSAELKKALDRQLCLVSPLFTTIEGEVHHEPRYDHYPRLLGLGVLDAPDPVAEQIFATLVERNVLNLYTRPCAAGVVLRSNGLEQAAARSSALLDELEVVGR